MTSPPRSARRRSRRILAAVPAYLVAVFMVAPLVVVVASSFTAGNSVSFPPDGFSLRWYSIALERRDFIEALGNSVNLATVSTIIAVVLGYISALVITRSERGVKMLSLVTLGPLFVSSAVLGLAFLMVMSRIGLLGSYQGLLLACTVTSLPFTTRMIGGVLAGIGTEVEQAARVYGASKVRALLTVNIPLAAPGIFAAAVYSFINVLDESVIINFIGSVRFPTFPLVLISHLRETYDPVASVFATLLLIITLVLVWVVSKSIGLDRLSQSTGGRST